MQKIRGQITVFLAITLIGVMSMLAFVVNVGLFVKAKINLQNAVDAAAWAGAAVQARQMTTLAYLNWEMRNVYKEWMFKYYVLGQFSLTDTRLDTSYALSPEQNGHAGMSFRMRQFYPRGHSHHNPKSFDPYNVPSICLHFGNDKSAKNICELYDVPGIPRFETVGIPGISELHETLVNNITKVKMNDCSRRSNYNFATAMIYAYGNGHVFSQDTLVASDRPGAWPSAFELAVRARNVEAFVNRRPIEEGICTFDSSCKNPADLDNENTPVNERPIKAYWSAFRNLNKEMQANFKLTELPPQPYHPQGLSAFLIPEEAAYDGNKFADNKYYIDLQMYPLNLVTFFTSFVSQAGTFEEVASEAECRGTRVGIPMPAYLFGFVKNPEVLTYYAVKGETRFTGLFFPFLDKRGIKLEAYAAAKPFGGRIGPMLFSVTGDAKTKLQARDNPGGQQSSLPYISGLDVTLPPGHKANDFVPGYPVPTTQNFWVSQKTDTIGGVPENNENGLVKFAVPNLLYDFENSVDELSKHTTGDIANIIYPATSEDGQASGGNSGVDDVEFGLYDKHQFQQFASNVPPKGNAESVILSSREIEHALLSVRRPTQYEAMNYLLPVCQRSTGSNLDTAANTETACPDDNTPVQIRYFAPFYGDNSLLYKNRNDVVSAAGNYIQANHSAIDAYIDAMKNVAVSILNAPHTDQKAVIPAAQGFYNLGPVSSTSGNVSYPGIDGEVASIAGKFNQFFKGTGSVPDPNGQSVVPLTTALQTLWSDQEADKSGNRNFKDYYVTFYLPPILHNQNQTSVDNAKIASAFLPGRRQGTSDMGEYAQTSTNRDYVARRNFYSTKFIPLKSLIAGNRDNYIKNSAFREKGRSSYVARDLASLTFQNPLNFTNVSEFSQGIEGLDH